MTYWGWLLVGIALLLTALSGTQTSLCQRMRSVPVYRGLTYWEVQQIAKAAPTSITPCGEDTICRWVSGRYQIALRFNRYDVCLGVEEEIDGAAAVRRNADGRRGGTGGKRVCVH